jgi:hypothetical protein
MRRYVHWPLLVLGVIASMCIINDEVYSLAVLLIGGIAGLSALMNKRIEKGE